MKKLIVLLMALLLCVPAWAEQELPLEPFVIAAPEGVIVEPGAGGVGQTFVHPNGTTRVVAMTIDRVPDPDGDHAAALEKLMAQFAPDAGAYEPLMLTAGFYGLRTVTEAAREGLNGQRVDQVNVMVLWQTALQGELLILSGYDMAGDTAATAALMDALLQRATVNDAPVMRLPAIAQEME